MAIKKRYITIKNFSKFQHYQNDARPVIWLKLYFKILDSSRFFNLTEFERWVFIGLLVLSGMKNNRIPYEKKFLKAKILHYETDEELLEPAINSLINEDLIAIKSLSSRYQSASLEKSRVEKSRVDTVSIQKIFKMFQDSVNPTINYGHKTNRQSVLDLLKLYPIDKLEELVKYAISVQGEKYAPTIITPYQLKEKLGNLKIYHDRQKESGKGRNIII